jgi:hypothetical protein
VTHPIIGITAHLIIHPALIPIIINMCTTQFNSTPVVQLISWIDEDDE